MKGPKILKLLSLLITFSILFLHTANGLLVRNVSHKSESSYTVSKGPAEGPTSSSIPQSFRQLSPKSQAASQTSTYPSSYVSSYYPSSYGYNLSRQDNNDGFGSTGGFSNGGGGVVDIGGPVGGGDISFGASDGGAGALGVGGGILATVGIVILAVIIIPLILLFLLGLLIIPFSPLLLLLLLLLIPAVEKKIIFGEPPGTGIFPRSFHVNEHFISNIEAIFKIILQAIENKEIPCSDDISCQNSLKNEIGSKRESPGASTERPEWKKVLAAAIKQTQGFTLQVVRRINTFQKNVSKISSAAAANAVSKISQITS